MDRSAARGGPSGTPFLGANRGCRRRALGHPSLGRRRPVRTHVAVHPRLPPRVVGRGQLVGLAVRACTTRKSERFLSSNTRSTPDRREWLRRHCLRAAESGLLLPHACFFSDGRNHVIDWSADDQDAYTHMPGYFIEEGRVFLDRDETRRDFVGVRRRRPFAGRRDQRSASCENQAELGCDCQG